MAVLRKRSARKNHATKNLRMRKRSARKNHATKNLRISGSRRSAHAREHYQSGVIDKAPLEKMAPEDSGERVVATWPAIAGANLYMDKAYRFRIVEEEIEKFPLAQSYTVRTKNGAPTSGAIKLQEELGAEGKLVCILTGRALGYVSRSGVPYGVSSFQLDHHDPKRPTMSQGASYADYLHAYEQGHIVIKCYEYMGLQYNLQGMQHGGNSRNYAAP